MQIIVTILADLIGTIQKIYIQHNSRENEGKIKILFNPVIWLWEQAN